jgi:hypothetical protein
VSPSLLSGLVERAARLTVVDGRNEMGSGSRLSLVASGLALINGELLRVSGPVHSRFALPPVIGSPKGTQVADLHGR